MKFEEATFSPNPSCNGTIVPLDGTSKQMFIKIYDASKNWDKIKLQGLYASKIHKGPHESISHTYNKMKSEILSQGFKLGKLAYEEYLIDDLATDNQSHYVTLIKIEVI